MRLAYVELAKLASLEEITAFWNSQNHLDGLFIQKKIDITDIKREGIVFGRPTRMEIGVYRLILEIDHVHRVTICERGQVFKQCVREFPESCLSVETVGDYGFTGLDPWERWQMMFLYQELFNTPKFDAREMLAARRSADTMDLTNYIEKMVDVKKYWNYTKQTSFFHESGAAWIGMEVRSRYVPASTTVGGVGSHWGGVFKPRTKSDRLWCSLESQCTLVSSQRCALRLIYPCLLLSRGDAGNWPRYIMLILPHIPCRDCQAYQNPLKITPIA